MTATTLRPALTLTLAECGSDLCELAVTLRMLGIGMQRTEELVEQTRDRRHENLERGLCWNIIENRPWTRDEIEMSCRNELARARETARRTAQKALDDLALVVGELESGQ